MQTVIGPGGKTIELSTKRSVEKRKVLQERQEALSRELEATRAMLSECQRDLYEAMLAEAHITEIYRLARIHFPRLRGNKGENLSAADVMEIEKWISRVKSGDGLKDIADALEELGKYYPSDIKSNLYALVQKIIIGGSYHQAKKKRK